LYARNTINAIIKKSPAGKKSPIKGVIISSTRAVTSLEDA
jgi:hypothetical protein